jgi:hypothetical protein
MVTIPWMKQQDFCLRLGVLRALLAILPPHDRSIDRGHVLRRLDSIFFAPLSSHPSLEARARDALGGKLEKPTIAKALTQHFTGITVADGLLVTSPSASWGQPLDQKHSSKILEWGQASGFVGRGNQITERGRLLRSFFDLDAVKAFAAGKVDAWNPFDIPPIERVFLLYHLGEKDEVLWRVAVAAGLYGAGSTVDTATAHRFTAEAMKVLVARVQDTAPISEYARLRPLRDLAKVIEAEAFGQPTTARPQQPGPKKPTRLQSRTARHTTKNADHQAIPRCEMLVDLGILTKKVDRSLVGAALWKAKKSWRFDVTDAGAAFARAVDSATTTGPVAPWQWQAFARASAAAEFVGNARDVPLCDVLDLLFEAYRRISRPMGHTPLESVAVLTMLLALAQGKIVEIDTIHRLFLELKASGALQQHLFFAGRNELDRMFVVLRPTAQAPMMEWLTRGGMASLPPTA